MSECLVTTLKGVVDDDSLKYLGEFTLAITNSTFEPNQGCAALVANFGKSFKCFAEGGNLVSESGDVIGNMQAFPAGTGTIHIDENVKKVRLTGMYSCTSLSADRASRRKRVFLLKPSDISSQINIKEIALDFTRGIRLSEDYSYSDLFKVVKGLETFKSFDANQRVNFSEFNLLPDLKALTLSLSLIHI